MKLKPETPLRTKRKIMRLENECEILRTRIWKLTIAIEGLLVVVLAACVINFYAIR